RNYMRDEMEPGDEVLLYHSSTRVLGVYGLARVAGPAHPDSKQFEEGHAYEDPDSDPDDPTWWCVDLEHVQTFAEPVTRDAMKENPALEEMKVLQRGVRHSILPVTDEEFRAVRAMARRAG
ncbi:MAG TPA: EVE domain-containing protein, partial [Gemmatimonadota bacterium]|nr:EVE domain-containing protein [Gemmatimonadota bacterium]